MPRLSPLSLLASSPFAVLRLPVAASLLAVALTAGAGHAATLPVETPRVAYAQCMDLAREAPREGFGAAVAWEGLGGGEAARHCAAVALFEMGEYVEAAERLESLAKEGRQPLPLLLDLLAQAGAGWLQASRPGRAEAVLDTAIDLADRPTDGVPGALPGLLIDRATALADLGRDLEAIRDLDRALYLRPGDPDALTLRASTLRRTGSLEAALLDANEALARAPEHPGALLELGNISRMTGAVDAARTAWMRVLTVAPDGPEAAAARDNLARLDMAGTE